MPLNRSGGSAVLSSGAAGGQWQPCMLTWYDPALGGTNSSNGQANPTAATASGEPYNPNANTCAAPPQYPFGTNITFQYNGTSVTCRVNDRGGAITGSHFDLSRAAAQTLGIINAGVVNATFQVGAITGAPTAANNNSQGTQPSGGGGSILSVLTDIATGNIADLAVLMGSAVVTILKDAVLGFADWIIIPWWQWNQRAAQYYVGEELFSNDKDHWTALPWTAAFWGLGYWLFWTDPDAKNSSPAPVRATRIARHVRSAQSLPARRSLVKPKDVKERTAKKPKPVESRAVVTQTGTMKATRSMPVRVSGEYATRTQQRNSGGSEAPTDSTGANPIKEEGHANATNREPDSQHRAGNRPLPHSGGGTTRSPGEGKRNGGNPGRGRVSGTRSNRNGQR